MGVVIHLNGYGLCGLNDLNSHKAAHKVKEATTTEPAALLKAKRKFENNQVQLFFFTWLKD